MRRGHAKGSTVNKKVSSLLLAYVILAAGAFPSLTLADDAQGSQARSLAIVERLLQYCADSDAATAAKLRDKATELTKTLSKQQVVDLRQTTEYQSAYVSMDGFINKVDEHNTKRLCSESAAAQASSTKANK
jgi:hypothetical protein